MCTSSLAKYLREPVDGCSLALFRIVFGAIGVLSMIRVLANGWVESLYAGQAHHFTYPGLGWVGPPSAAGMYLLVVVVGLAAACVALGWRFRIAMTVFSLGFAWIEFIDVTTYLNHYWFVSLAGFLLIFAPVTNELAPYPNHRPVARGWVWLLRTQIAVVYVFAGLAKLNSDWLLHALPLRLWLPTRTDVPGIGRFVAEPWVAYAFSWAGALFDCTIVGFLLWRRTRVAAWFVVVAFHVATWRLFSIGVFPWLMIGATTMFFEPSWPRRVRARIGSWTSARNQPSDECCSWVGTGLRFASAAPSRRLLAGARGAACERKRQPLAVVLTQNTSNTNGPADPAVARPRFVLPAAITWVVIQALIPLRHLTIEGDYRWTGEGYRWSWNVLLTERGGDVSFRITDATTRRTWRTDAADRYTPLQWKAMSTDPELIRQAAHMLADEYGDDGIGVEVRADAFVSLNGRPAARLIDPAVDLAHEPWRLGHQPWILPAPKSSPP